MAKSHSEVCHPITYIYCCMSFLIAYNVNVNFEAMEKKLRIILERARDGIEPLEYLEQELLNLHSVSKQRELLKKWWKYFDKESVAVNCNDEEREEVINDFFNCG